jgi:ArsR family transcriptional regulator
MARMADTATELAAPASEEAALQRAASIFHTLSHPCRLRLLVALAGGQVCDVNTLVSLCGRPQPYVSQQLAVLRQAGLVTGDPNGQRVCYRLATWQVEAILYAVGILPPAL